MRVLIAEDDVGIRELLGDVLERQGHAPVTVADGQEAWELFQVQRFDVIISDWLMPRMEGPELCRRVRESDAPYTYLILLTALGDSQHHLHGRESGADDYLAKPFDIDDLYARMVTADRVTALHRQLEDVLLAARTAQHELNNRLGVVMGYAEMLAEYPTLPDGMCEVVEEIVRGAKELAETVDHLRRVTRIGETPRPALTGSTVNLTESVA